MIYFLRGNLIDKMEESIVIDVAGVWYEVFVPTTSGFYGFGEGEEIIVYTYMAVREDNVSLYGFKNKETLDMFKKLITVNGVGAKAGISILSALDINNLKSAIAFEDADAIAKANGVGKKTAQKIILDLKDKIGTVSSSENHLTGDNMDMVISGDIREEGINALVALGYSRGDARIAIMNTSKDITNVEDIIKEALKKLF